MVSNNELKYYSKLLQKKYRSSEGKFICEGKRLVEEGLRSNFKCEIVFYTENFQSSNPGFINEFDNVRIEKIKSAEFKKITDTNNPQGIAAVFIKPGNEFVKPDENIIVALDSINDPGNLGTILRNCDWFGINSVVVSENSTEVYNPKTLRASMGAIFHLDIFNCSSFIDELKNIQRKGYIIVSSDLEGSSLYKFTDKEKLVIIFSSEALGPSEELSNISDIKICIPGKGSAESLNVACASAVILAELTK
jgi:TrmH family RNA methyltransferase